MLSQACVKNSVPGVGWGRDICLGIGGFLPLGLGVHPPGRPPRDGHRSGRYASYRNAFLLCVGPVQHFDLPPFSSTHKQSSKYNTYLCMPLGCAIHDLACTVQHRGVQE